MGKAEDDLRKAGREVGFMAYGTGFDLLLLGVMLGAGFMIQWAIWLIVVGAALHRIFGGAGDAVEWVKAKMPNNPFRAR